MASRCHTVVLNSTCSTARHTLNGLLDIAVPHGATASSSPRVFVALGFTVNHSVTSASSPLSSLAVVPDLKPLRHGCEEGSDAAEDDVAPSPKLLRAKRQRMDYTAIADRTARKKPRFQHRQLYQSVEENPNAAAGNGSVTQLCASLIEVYGESEDDDENENENEASPADVCMSFKQNLPLDELHQLDRFCNACMPNEEDLTGRRRCQRNENRAHVDVFVPAAICGDHEPGRRRRHQVLGKKNKEPIAPSDDPVKSNPPTAPAPRGSTMGVAVAAMPHINAQQLFGLGFKCAMGLKGGKSFTAHCTAESVCDAIETLLRSTQEQTRS
ncbi:hypothetical protein FI667_g6864, partial [Globisporangium splendens]